MIGMPNERILLIGDLDRQMHAAITQVLPTAEVTSVHSVFDAIAELTATVDRTNNRFTSVLAAVDPIERRPEAAVRALRDLSGDSRLLLYGNATLEPLSRKMIEFGTNDYLITPASPNELQQVFGTPPMRLTPLTGDALSANQSSRIALLTGLPIAEILLDVLVQSPDAAVAAALKQINARIGPTMRLYYIGPDKPQPGVPDGQTSLTQAIRGDASSASLTLMMPLDEEEPPARHMLAQLAMMFGKLSQLRDRHNSMQRMLIHDELTGVYNGRYFKHFLNRICEKSRVMKFPVTLLLFDIDNFKKYNDQHGHPVGDDILKATAALMKQCTREHDVVARISGDEFAVIFWEKEGPRQPRDPRHHPSGRVPSTPQVIFERFRRLLQSTEAHEKYSVLGTTGQGTLTISGGMAVYPFDAPTPEELIARADEALMFGAKKCGKDSLYLVGGQNGSISSESP